MKPRPLYNLSLIAVAAGMPLIANAVTWDGSDSVDWTTGTNWVGDTAPVAADALEFSGTGIAFQPTNNDIAALTSFSAINFTNDGTVGVSDAAFTLDGNSITLGGNITTTAATVGTLEDTIALDLVLAGNRVFTAKTGHTLNVTGNISGDGAANVLSIGDNANPVNDEALITLSGDNTHFQTKVSRTAEVRVESDTALGTSVSMIRASTISLADSIDLTISGGIATTTGSGNQVIRLDEDAIAAVSSVTANIFANNGNGGSGLIFNVGENDTLTINGVISGTDKYTKTGIGSLILNGDNTHTGEAIVTAGSMTLSGSTDLGDGTSTLIMNGGSLDLGTTSQTVASVTISGAAAIGDTIHNGSISADTYNATLGAGNAIISANLAGTGNFAKSGNGTVTLSGTNTYTGTTTSSVGTLVATSAAALPGYTSPGNVIFDGGTIGVQVAGAGWTPAELSDLLTNATKTSGGLGIDTTNGDFTPSAAFTPATMGPLGLTKLGANSLTLDQANSYTGNTNLSEGTLNINSATALGDAASSFFIGNGTTIDNTSGSAITLTNNNSVILPGDGFTFGGSNDLNLGSGPVQLNLPPNNTTRIITLNGTASTLTLGDSTSPARGGNTNIQVDGAGNTLVFASLGLNEAGSNKTNEWSGDADVTVIGGVLDGGDGGQRFTYSGTGTFTIGGASTYTGNTTVTGGTLALGPGGSLSDNSNVFINGGMIDLDAAVSDAIAALTIVGVNGDAPLPDGTYGSTASGADNGGLGVGTLDAYLTGSGVFTITTATAFETWSGGELFDEDTNGDGVDNGLAWMLGAVDVNADALGLLPDSAESSGDLVMTFTIVDPIAPAQLFVEYTNDLTGLWTQAEVPAITSTVGVVDFVIVDNGGTLSVTATIPASAASAGGELFGRLSAIEN